MRKVNINSNISRIKTFLFLFFLISIVPISAVGFSGTVEVPNPIKRSDIAEIIEASLLWLLGIAGSVALLMLIIAGVMYITSFGDEQKVVTAKKIFNFTVVGLILVLLSYSIIVVLRDVLT